MRQQPARASWRVEYLAADVGALVKQVKTLKERVVARGPNVTSVERSFHESEDHMSSLSP